MTPRELRARRIALGWTPGDLAGVLGVNVDNVSKWEAGASEIENGRKVDLLLRSFERHALLSVRRFDESGTRRAD